MIEFTAACTCVWLQCVGPKYTKIWVGLWVLGWLLCVVRIAGLGIFGAPALVMGRGAAN